MTQSFLQGQLGYGGQAPFAIPRRELGDLPGSVRFTDWSGGYDDQKAENYYGDPFTQPTYWEAQNMDAYTIPGLVRLCAPLNAFGSAEATDKEYLLYPFNVAIYRFPTANFDATLVQKTTQATGVPTWQALANVYPGATAVKNAVPWRGKLYVASGENLLRIVDTTETWTTLAAPAGVAAALAGFVAVGQDDLLMVWWESKGLWSFDGTATWTQVYPSVSTSVSTDQFCDLMFMGTGSFIFVTRDATGTSSLHEYSIEPTGKVHAIWLQEPGLRVWPQGGDTFQGFSWIVGRLGSRRNVGVLYRKAKLAAPEPIAILNTNLATVGQLNLDWSFRCFMSVGDIAYIGGSSRQDRNACLYHFEVDQDGNVLHPSAVIGGVGGPIYSLCLLPYAAAGASSSDRIFCSVIKNTYYKDADGGTDPTTDASPGFIQFSDIDLGLSDHLKRLAAIEANVLTASTGGVVQFQFRVDPVTPDVAWTILGSLTQLTGLTHFDAPNDSAVGNQYGTRVRVLQVRAVFTKPASGTTRDLLDTASVRFSEVLPLSTHSPTA